MSPLESARRTARYAPGREPVVMTASARVLEWLAVHRGPIIEVWVERLSVISDSYRQRPTAELYVTVSEAFDAHQEALVTGDSGRIQDFIDFITVKRLEAGFPLSDVQRAFELFRSTALEKLKEQGRGDLILEAIEPINSCLSFTIHRFSDHFQQMHEQAIVRYAEDLENQVAARTAELAESQRRYKTLVEEINDGYFIVQEGCIVLANQAFCQMHLSNPEAVLGQPFLDYVSPADRERVAASYQRTLAGQPPSGQLEYRRLGPPPEHAHTEIKARTVDLGEGPVVIGICRDVSRRVAMEAKVREHERMAYVGQLTASLSHEIRNPLSSIKMNLQILARKLKLGGYDQRRLEITVQQVGRLEGILRQLLDTARPVSLVSAPLDMAVLAKGCVELLEAKAAKKNLKVAQSHVKDMPMVIGDAGKLEQAVINLLLNAIEASPEGGKLNLWTKPLRGRTPYVELGVTDNGPGVPPEEMPRLFTPFHTTKPHGTGLGLANVKRIMDAHGGEVEVQSKPGKGASFILRLPL